MTFHVVSLAGEERLSRQRQKSFIYLVDPSQSCAIDFLFYLAPELRTIGTATEESRLKWHKRGWSINSNLHSFRGPTSNLTEVMSRIKMHMLLGTYTRDTPNPDFCQRFCRKSFLLDLDGSRSKENHP